MVSSMLLRVVDVYKRQTWDCAAVSLRAIDQNGNLLPYCSEAVQLSVEGPVEILGPSVVPLRGGMAGTRCV